MGKKVNKPGRILDTTLFAGIFISIFVVLLLFSYNYNDDANTMKAND